MRWAFLDEVATLVQRAGAFQLEHFRSAELTVDEKARNEFVSFVDVESEMILQKGLKELLPEAGFFGEETGKSGEQNLVWIVDPIDGTSNYVSGLDQFSISVALVDNGSTRLGLVYKPATQEIFSAIRGQGVRHNGTAVTPPQERPMSEALIGTGFPYRSPDLLDTFFGCAKDVLGKSRGIRRMGSAALDLAYVGCGFLQGFWESDLQCYDVAAALLILEENGCVITNGAGEPYDMFKDRILVAGVPGVQPELLVLVKKAY